MGFILKMLKIKQDSDVTKHKVMLTVPLPRQQKPFIHLLQGHRGQTLI